jgi:hypothetical protein
MPRPVIIHRAILGSLERFIAIITEHFAGKWYVILEAFPVLNDRLINVVCLGRSGFLLVRSSSSRSQHPMSVFRLLTTFESCADHEM